MRRRFKGLRRDKDRSRRAGGALNPAHGGFDGPPFVDNTMDDEPLHTNPNLAYAVQMVHATCCLAGSASYLADIREDLRAHGIIRAVRDHDTPALFDWLIEALSFQGISDTVAAGYMARTGSVRWSDIAEALSRTPSCPKLGGYWRFYDCRYHKGSEHVFRARAHRRLPPAPPSAAQRPPEPDGVQPVPVHAGRRR